METCLLIDAMIVYPYESIFFACILGGEVTAGSTTSAASEDIAPFV